MRQGKLPLLPIIYLYLFPSVACLFCKQSLSLFFFSAPAAALNIFIFCWSQYFARSNVIAPIHATIPSQSHDQHLGEGLTTRSSISRHHHHHHHHHHPGNRWTAFHSETVVIEEHLVEVASNLFLGPELQNYYSGGKRVILYDVYQAGLDPSSMPT